MKRLYSVWILIASLSLPSCLNTEPKRFGDYSADNLNPNINNNLSNFRIAFAYSTATTITANQTVYLQGAANTSADFTSVCNSAGTSCRCDFLDGTDTLLASTSDSNPAAEIRYSTSGNYVTCLAPVSMVGIATHIRLRDQTHTRATDIVTTIKTSATVLLSDIVTGLDRSKIRKISNYSCIVTYIQQSGAWGTCPNTATGGYFNYLRTHYKFYVYADATINNYTQKAVDYLYGGNNGQQCGLQIRELDCYNDGAIGYAVPVADFGLYSQASGAFTTPIYLTSGLNISNGQNTLNGYAAPIDATSGECPPGLVKKQFFTVTPNPLNYVACTTAGCNDSNMTAIQDARTEDTTFNSSFTVERVSGGVCNGTTTCTTAPSSSSTIGSLSYTATGAVFCVIPATMLTDI
jgi:hypothetical protein